jgi:hypothetical protein
MITSIDLEKIITEALESLKDSKYERIETEQLFMDLYGDRYLEIKRKMVLEKNFREI